jgi:hypothetical protein
MPNFSIKKEDQKKVIYGVIAAGVLIVLILVANGWDKFLNNEIDGQVILKGEFACLPFKEEQKLPEECVLGFKSNRGDFYALDISKIQAADTNISENEAIAVTGALLGKNATSTQKLIDDFKIRGVIQVNTLLRTK